MGAKRWTDDQIQLLMAEYPDRYACEVADMLGRPVKQVYQKAKQACNTTNTLLNLVKLEIKMKGGRV